MQAQARCHLHQQRRQRITVRVAGKRVEAEGVCGRTGFVTHIIGTAPDAGWPASQDSGDGKNGEFQVRIANNGRTYPVRPDQSIVDALAECGIDIPVSCKEGVCDACLTCVLDGQIDHRDYYQTRTDRARHDQMLSCCSRAKDGLLVLDL